MNKNNDMSETGASAPAPKKSIRNVSLPAREDAAARRNAPKEKQITAPAESEVDSLSAAAPAARFSRKTKHLAIENQDGVDLAPPSRSYSRSEDGKEPVVREDWRNHAEKAFLSSDDLAAERKMAKSAKDADDFGNTSSESHFEPLKAERKKKHRSEVQAAIEADLGRGASRPGAARRPKRGRAFAVTLVALVAIFGLMQTVFARVSIVLPTADISVTLADEALPNAVASTVITKNSEKKVEIEGIKTVAVSNKATGTVIIYNNYSTEEYRLVKTTRLSTANGSIYRLTADVIVPGRKTVGGKTVPGSINAKVEADLPGSEYNAKGGLDLTFPGLIPGTQKHKQITAKTSANFTGGSKGSSLDLAASGIENAIKTAKDEAAAAAIAEARELNPNLVFLEDSVNVLSSFDSTKIPAAPAGGGPIAITVRFTAKIIGLNRDGLKKEIEGFLSAKNGYPISFSPDVLDMLLYDVAETPDEALSGGQYMIRVSGGVSGSFNEELQNALKQELAGKTLEEARLIVDAKFPGQAVVIKAWPFWKSEVPSDTNKVKIVIKQ